MYLKETNIGAYLQGIEDKRKSYYLKSSIKEANKEENKKEFEKLSRLRMSGKTLKEIAKLYGVTGEAIRQKLYRFGIILNKPPKNYPTICTNCNKNFNKRVVLGSKNYCSRLCFLTYKSIHKLTKEEVWEKRRQGRKDYYNTKKGKEVIKRSCKKSYFKYPEKSKARAKVHHAVIAGKLLKPVICPSCNSTERRIEAHHPDYSKPLEIMWLCTPCHREQDRKEKRLTLTPHLI